MTIVLDTSILVDLERRERTTIRRLGKIRTEHPQPMHITYAVYMEYLFGALVRRRDRERVERHLQGFPVIESNEASNRKVAEIRYQLRKTGSTISAADILIAASTIAAGGTLVTKDHHFKGIAGLSCIILD